MAVTQRVGTRLVISMLGERILCRFDHFVIHKSRRIFQIIQQLNQASHALQ